MTDITQAMEKADEVLAQAFYEYQQNGLGTPWASLHPTLKVLWIRGAAAGRTAALSALEEAGFVLVPREPTHEMITIGQMAGDTWNGYTEIMGIYNPMLQTRPRLSPPQSEPIPEESQHDSP